MSKEISWFGGEEKKPKEVVRNTKDAVVGIGKLMVVGLALGLGLRAFGGGFGGGD